ncbi:hypothetical protein L218DRAFT_38845 [Marasmius fiardii PR-910]|nr:hypothetical protein L218DRAFT_38845 [Marasmius fiardii PR-910]
MPLVSRLSDDLVSSKSSSARAEGEGPSAPSSAPSIPPAIASKRFSPEDYVAVGTIHVSVSTTVTQNPTQDVPMVARVSLVDYRGQVILDTHVRPTWVDQSEWPIDSI